MKASRLIEQVEALMEKFGDKEISIPLQCVNGGWGPIAEIQNVGVESDEENFYIWSKQP